MTELEKVEKLREKADVSFAEAKEGLATANGDILDALIYLETQGKATVPAGGGFFSGSGAPDPTWESSQGSGGNDKTGGNPGSANESFSDMMKRFGKFCMMLIRKGNNNYLEAAKDGEQKFSCPVTIVVLFTLFFFWITVPLLIIGLFFGFRYRFRGAELGKDSVNQVMGTASDIVDDVKQKFNDRQTTEE